jgi:hypothetical protein
MECTDFDVLIDESDTLEYNVDVLTSYLHFCIDSVVPKKVVTCYPNNKPWVTKELKELLNEKKIAFCTNKRDNLKGIQKSINCKISLCKRQYKTKVENMFKQDAKSAWNGIRLLTGMKKSNVIPDVQNIPKFCDDLNNFYARFDKVDFSVIRNELVDFHRARPSHPIELSEAEVVKCLRSLKAGKAGGPDKINTNVLKLSALSLAPSLCKIFQRSLNEGQIPKQWKTSEIIPVPKKTPPTCLNDYRPIALTSVMMKCFEKVVKNLLNDQIKNQTDSYQFAYTQKRCVEDASLCLIDYTLKHVDQANSSAKKHFVKILFIDFSSAFNTIQPHLMMKKLYEMNVSSTLILWINDFLTEHLQYVKFLDTISNTIVINTGAPQGCVLSPMLFTLYTSDCRCENESCQLVKYADDTALVARCVNDDVIYRSEVQRFCEWCCNNYLELNVSKTKEMVVDFRRTPCTHEPLYINNELVEAVSEYKYLGLTVDHNFKFSSNVNKLYKKVNSRMYFVRMMHKLCFDERIINLFYTAIIQSVVSFSIVCWFGNAPDEVKRKLNKVIKHCTKLGVTCTVSLADLYERATKQRLSVIINDTSHPLNEKFELLPSGRRLRNTKCRTSRYQRSFVPSSINIANLTGLSPNSIISV